MRILVAIMVVATVVGRFIIEPRLSGIPSLNLSYEAFAHLFVGGLFGFFLATGKRILLWLVICLSLFELAMFLIQKSGA